MLTGPPSQFKIEIWHKGTNLVSLALKPVPLEMSGESHQGIDVKDQSVTGKICIKKA